MAAAPPYPAPPQGLIVELVTPLKEDGRLDAEGLGRLVARVAPAADGILAGSPGLGEALDLPLEVRRDLWVHLLAAAPGGTPLFFGITGATWEETRALAQMVAAERRRVPYPGPVFLADLALWYHSNRGLPQACQGLLADLGLPLVLLNLPAVISRRAPLFKRRNIRTHVFKKMVSLPGLVGVIYQGDLRRFLNYHYAAASRPGFAFYEADEINFLTRPGAWGVVSAGAQLLPGVWQEVSRFCLHPEEAAEDQGRRLQLWERSRRLLEMARIYQPRPPALVKGVLAAQGVIAGGVMGEVDPVVGRLLRLLDSLPD